MDRWNDIIGQASCAKCKQTYNLVNAPGFGHLCNVVENLPALRPIQSHIRAFYNGKMWEVVTEYHKGSSLFGRLERINEHGILEHVLPSKQEVAVRNEWTGLFDKNGQQIFGGDIVKWQFTTVDVYDLVVWDSTRAGFLPFIGTYSYDGLIYPTGSETEVIGNIYESPDLEKLTKATNV